MFMFYTIVAISTFIALAGHWFLWKAITPLDDSSEAISWPPEPAEPTPGSFYDLKISEGLNNLLVWSVLGEIGPEEVSPERIALLEEVLGKYLAGVNAVLSMDLPPDAYAYLSEMNYYVHRTD